MIFIQILDSFRFKTFANNKFHHWYKWVLISDKVENIVEKRENAGYQHFLLFAPWFQKVSFPGSLNVNIVCKELNTKRGVWHGQKEKCGVCNLEGMIWFSHEAEGFSRKCPLARHLKSQAFNPLPNDKLYRHIHFESTCRQQYKCDTDVEICFW